MFFYRREYNPVLEEHRCPQGKVFAVGAGSGALVGIVWAFLCMPYLYDSVQLLEVAIGVGVFFGLLSVGVVRAREFVPGGPQKSINVRQRLSGVSLHILVIVLCAVIGAVPFAFIDYVGGDLWGRRANNADFVTVLCGAAGIGFVVGCVSSVVQWKGRRTHG